MRLVFEGQAIVETRSGGVNFAGQYVDPDGRTRDVLCRVTGEALGILAGLRSPTPNDLLDAYHQHSEKLNQLASVQYSAGIADPYITTLDIPRGWLRSIEAA
jgi:hypothetical protein